VIDAGDNTEMNAERDIPDELKALSIHTVFADPRDRGEPAQPVRASAAKMQQCATDWKGVHCPAALEHTAARLADLLGEQILVHE